MSLNLADFEVFGELAQAGMEAAKLALEEQARSFEQDRIPINGAAVTRLADGTLKVVAIGRNSRIPAPDANDIGYPTDHGETGAFRTIEDYGAVDWPATVFVTTLAPCIMCTWAIEDLHAHGLRSIVILDSSFEGGKARLEALPGMRIVRLSHPDSVRRMRAFSQRYPWDWAADIGEVPPRSAQREAIIAKARAEGSSWLSARAEGEAAVIGPDADVLAVASDGCQASGGNCCRSAVISAIGQAGSAVNLRECAIVWRHSTTKADLAAFGRACVGACVLFRPAVLVTYPIDTEVSEHLEAAGIVVVVVAPSRGIKLVECASRRGGCSDWARRRYACSGK